MMKLWKLNTLFHLLVKKDYLFELNEYFIILLHEYIFFAEKENKELLILFESFVFVLA